jgi:beta-glucanase (GH16 family)
MKKVSIGIGLIIILIIFGGCQISNRNLKLSWKENFSSKELNKDIWTKIPRGHSNWERYMSDFDSCYTIRHGKLILKILPNNYLHNDTAKYLTGGVYTFNKHNFENGRIEIRAKYGNAVGSWPAIWLLSSKSGWPNGGEIDIMEHYNKDSIAYCTVHSYYTLELGKENTPPHSSYSKIRYNKFNTYAVEIHSDSLVFYVNNKRTLVYPKINVPLDQKQFVFADEQYFLLMDMQLVGSGGKIEKSEYPMQMEIDWVKYYEFKK